MKTADWIRQRRLEGLLLRASSIDSPAGVVSHLTAMQSQIHGYARWSVAQRVTGSPAAAAIDAAFDAGDILRTHVLRPTWHYVAAGDLGWLMRLSGPRVDAGNASMYRRYELDAATLARSNDVLVRAVAAAPCTRTELYNQLDVDGLSTAGIRGVLMLMHAELTSVICSGPMLGKQHTYAAFDRQVPFDDGPDGEEAIAELAWRYFSTRGPATLKDFAWWSGLKMGEARRGLELSKGRIQSFETEKRTYWFTGEAEPTVERPRIDLVQCYDEAIISYSESRDILRSDRVSFPVPSNIDGYQHVTLLDGSLLGHWRVSTTGSAETRTAVPLDQDQESALDDASERYRQFAQG